MLFSFFLIFLSLSLGFPFWIWLATSTEKTRTGQQETSQQACVRFTFGLSRPVWQQGPHYGVNVYLGGSASWSRRNTVNGGSTPEHREPTQRDSWTVMVWTPNVPCAYLGAATGGCVFVACWARCPDKPTTHYNLGSAFLPGALT